MVETENNIDISVEDMNVREEHREIMEGDIQTSSEDDVSPERPEAEVEQTNERHPIAGNNQQEKEEIKHKQRFCFELHESTDEETFELQWLVLPFLNLYFFLSM